ncbi:hypothetical protein BOX15_Mlig004832g1, partial [Macrostomum lignano]
MMLKLCLFLLMPMVWGTGDAMPQKLPTDEAGSTSRRSIFSGVLGKRSEPIAIPIKALLPQEEDDSKLIEGLEDVAIVPQSKKREANSGNRDMYSGLLGKKAVYSGLLGKRAMYSGLLGKRDMYSGLLGKKAMYSGLLGKRAMYSGLLGKRAMYSGLLGKRAMYSGLLGKRAMYSGLLGKR